VDRHPIDSLIQDKDESKAKEQDLSETPHFDQIAEKNMLEAETISCSLSPPPFSSSSNQRTSPKKTRIMPDSFEITSPPPSRISKSTSKKARRRKDDPETSPSQMPLSVGHKRPRSSPKSSSPSRSPSSISPVAKKTHLQEEGEQEGEQEKTKDIDSSLGLSCDGALDSNDESKAQEEGDLSRSSFDLYITHKQFNKALTSEFESLFLPFLLFSFNLVFSF